MLGRGAGAWSSGRAGAVGVRFLPAFHGRLGRRRGRPHPPGWAAGASRGLPVAVGGRCGSCRDPPGPLGAAPPPNKEGRRLPRLAAQTRRGGGGHRAPPLACLPSFPHRRGPRAPRPRGAAAGWVGSGGAGPGSIVCSALPGPPCPPRAALPAGPVRSESCRCSGPRSPLPWGRSPAPGGEPRLEGAGGSGARLETKKTWQVGLEEMHSARSGTRGLGSHGWIGSCRFPRYRGFFSVRFLA